MSEGKLRMVENSDEVLYTIPVLGSLYLAGNPDKSEYFFAGLNDGGASTLA